MSSRSAPPSAVRTIYLSFLVFLILATLAPLPAADSPSRQPSGINPSVDELLGRFDRRRFASALAAKRYGGRSWKWEQYSAWGRELATTGRVQRPPIGPAPSPLMAPEYRCIHCHNFRREDARLTLQDPEARERLLRDAKPEHPDRRSDTLLSLTPAPTLWGAVNREKFYNGLYSRYHTLEVASGKPMNPESLADAVQVCCRYCSCGRFPQAWELDSLLAFLWDLEVRWQDLGLQPVEADTILAGLRGDRVQARVQAREALRKSYLRASEAQQMELPESTDGDTVTYAGGVSVTGDATAGKMLYLSACAGCHGNGVHKLAGKDLLRSDRGFHRHVWIGTEGDDTYMPRFTRQRLSQRQATDIRAYLRSLP